MKFKYTLVLGITSIASLTHSLHAAQDPVDLGSAGSFAILSKAGISTTGTTTIHGDIGVSPIDSTAITAFSLTLDATETFATSPLVTGRVFASDYSEPTPANMTTAVGDMEIAYTDAAGRVSGDAITELGAGDISGQTVAPGLYKWGTGLLINADVYLSGPANKVWIFQIANNLTLADGARIILSGGAQPANIFWQVAGEVTLGTTAHFEGIILSNTAIHLNTGATINGALYAHTAVTLDSNAVTIVERSGDLVRNWFGLYSVLHFDSQAGIGWIYHFQHGWIYMEVQAENDIWLWHPAEESWLWTSEAIHPYFYNATSSEWVYFDGELWSTID
ncbi:MAG: DUF3494 domain-containing protein [Opitutales bacterium]|nr:DUF3494 domain-containing protein [Opitutales bacterium]